jgi:hypothetical protein
MQMVVMVSSTVIILSPTKEVFLFENWIYNLAEPEAIESDGTDSSTFTRHEGERGYSYSLLGSVSFILSMMAVVSFTGHTFYVSLHFGVWSPCQ